MKIVFLTDEYPPRSTGGSGQVVAALARGLSLKGHKVSVVTAVQDPGYAGQIKKEGIDVYSIYAPSNESFRAYKSLYNRLAVNRVRRILEEIKADIVHAHNLHQYLSYACLKVAKAAGAKVFLTVHDVMLIHYGKLTEFIDSENPLRFSSNYHVSAWQLFVRYGLRYNPFRNVIIRHYLRFVDRIFAVSGALKLALEQNGIGKVEVIHNGIDVEAWQISAEAVSDFRSKYKLIGRKVILFGGRISGLKGGEQAARALALIKKEVPEAVLLIVGKTNEYSSELRKLALELNIEKDLIATGWLEGDDLKAAYNASDVVVVPSLYFDPFNLFNLEGMACKKPVVATCFGGSPEIVVDKETGYIVNPYDIDFMSEKIIALLKNSAKARVFGESGFRRAQEHFNTDIWLDDHVRYYQG